MYLSIPPFLQFLDCNSQINMFSRVRSFNMFLLRKICQYLKLNTCLWWCTTEWHNLELKPKWTSKDKMEMLDTYREAPWWLISYKQTRKSRRTVYKKNKKQFNKTWFVQKPKTLFYVTCGPRRILLYQEPPFRSRIFKHQPALEK